MKIDNLVLIAGGLATRLKPVTESIPKSMMEVNGKPFISHQLELLKKRGIKRVIICAGYLGDQIEIFVKDGKQFGIEIVYSFDSDKLLGTGGAIKKALAKTENVFFVMYGDSYLNTDFKNINEYFLEKNSLGLMTVFRNESKWDKSNIELMNGKIINYDKKNLNAKMKFIDYGLGILNKEAFDDFKDKEVFDLEEVYKNLLKKDNLEAFEVKDRFYEIGSFTGLDETIKYFTMSND